MSRYFTVDEMRCHSGEAYPAVWVDDRLAALFSVLDAVRERWGGHLTVVSGYRSPAFNAALAKASAARNGGVSGVASSSQHIQGRAADVRPAEPTVARCLDLHHLVKSMYDKGELSLLGGLGVYPGWCHLDVRAKVDGRLAQWTGVGVGSEIT